jgi:hypothetical protein
MLLAGIQANFGLDPRLKHSGVTSWDVVPAFSSSVGAKIMNNFVVKPILMSNASAPFLATALPRSYACV